jgi:hypothetical protein
MHYRCPENGPFQPAETPQSHGFGIVAPAELVDKLLKDVMHWRLPQKERGQARGRQEPPQVIGARARIIHSLQLRRECELAPSSAKMSRKRAAVLETSELAARYCRKAR